MSFDNKGETREAVRCGPKTLQAQRSGTIFAKSKNPNPTSMIREGTSIFQHDTKTDTPLFQKT